MSCESLHTREQTEFDNEGIVSPRLISFSRIFSYNNNNNRHIGEGHFCFSKGTTIGEKISNNIKAGKLLSSEGTALFLKNTQ